MAVEQSDAVPNEARAALAAVRAALKLEQLPEALALTLSRAIDGSCRDANGCQVVGLAGAQGSGKSTLARVMQALLEHAFQRRTVVVSLDDYYLPHEARRRLAERVHPLLVSRGVPGTHDVAALQEALRKLRAGRHVELLEFSKAADDRSSAARSWDGANDVVLLEGWCVGARAQGPGTLQPPINALEREEDPDGRFRRSVNDQLAGPYRALWQELDRSIFLAVPSLAAVRQFRGEQEEKLRASAHGRGVMSDAQLERFIEHYDRVTQAMLDEAPRYADVVVRLDRRRQASDVVFNTRA
jgi:D-glycerate 3-kinase